MSLKTRLTQRKIIYVAGLVISIIGLLGFISTMLLGVLGIYYPKINEVGLIGMGLVGLGMLYGIYFAKLGWHQNLIIDFFLNQLSILLTSIGFVFCIKYFIIDSLGRDLLLIAFLLIFLGIILAGLGMKYTISNDKGA